jgi:hypothetical protein
MNYLELRGKQLLVLLSVTALSACASLQNMLPSKNTAPAAPPAVKAPAPVQPAPAPAPAVTPAAPAVSNAQQILNDGSDLYDKGEFSAAIKKLSGSNEIWSADKAIQLKALKLMAFSYCVTGRSTLGRQQFERALRMDENFNLEPGERNHPLWGPVFEQARKIVANEAAAAAKRKAAKKPAATDSGKR